MRVSFVCLFFVSNTWTLKRCKYTGLVFIGEGVMSGCGDFMQLAISTIVATAGCLAALNVFPKQYGLLGVWMGFGVFNLLRLSGVAIHQFHTSTIAPRKIPQ